VDEVVFEPNMGWLRVAVFYGDGRRLFRGTQ
jgi:hypothetical protein